MKKLPYLYITSTAITAVLILQSIWFMQNYRMMENELFYQLNNAFLESAKQESKIRFDNHLPAINRLPEKERSLLNLLPLAVENKVRWHNKGEENINEFMGLVLYQEFLFKADSLGIATNIPDYTQLDSIFRVELLKAGFIHPEFRIDYEVPIDPALYPYLNDLVFDSARVKNSHLMTTSRCPTQLNYNKGYQGVLLNPMEEIIRQLRSFLMGSILLSAFIIICIGQQISLIRRQRRIARQGEDFSYAMIHDMKTPLSSILMGARILQSGKINNIKKKKYLDILKDEGEHLLALSNKVLNLSKLEKQEVELEKEEISLHLLIEDLMNKFSVNAGKPVRFFTQLEASTVYADMEYLKEAISNLIDNAIKYSKESVDIHISSRTDSAGMTLISVEDNGIGIPQKEQGKMFDKFERSASVRKNQKNRTSGFGLGLNYVYRIIEAHNGIVTLTSKEGEYSRFTIHLPAQIKI